MISQKLLLTIVLVANLQFSVAQKNNHVKEKFTEVSQQLKNKYDEWGKTVLAPIPL